MIKLLNILQEITVGPNHALQKVLDYIRNGSQGDLNLEGTNIKRLPNGLKVVRGDLNLTNSQIELLPDNLTVEGSLRLEHTPIRVLPKGLEVRVVLWARDSQIEFIPNDLKVEHRLYLGNTPLVELLREKHSRQYARIKLKKMFPGVKGNILIP